MRYLILSDIHANWEGLQAVLEHAQGKYDQVLCCGDVIGYGADPNAVTEWVRMHVAGVVRGNHDKASVGLDDLEWFNPVARAAAVWTHRELRPDNAEYIRSLPGGPLLFEDFQIVHGSPLDEDEYILSATDAGLVFAYLDTPLTFFGHTHLQGGFILNHARVETIGKTPRVRGAPNAGTGCGVRLPDQSRFRGPAARWRSPRGLRVYNAEERFVIFYRLPYDVETAQEKIRRRAFRRCWPTAWPQGAEG